LTYTFIHFLPDCVAPFWFFCTIYTRPDHFNLYVVALYFLQIVTKTLFNMFAPSLLILLASSGLIDARSVHEHIHGLMHRRAANADLNSTTLSADAIQKGSFNNGQLETGSDPGQAPSLTSQSNFINNCVGKTLTNGLQITTGSCNGISKNSNPDSNHASNDCQPWEIFQPRHR
jgi:hypothetical protein